MMMKKNGIVPRLFLLLGALPVGGSAAWVVNDCLDAAKNVLALYNVGIRGFSFEGDIEYEIQESRRTVLAALSAATFEQRKSLIEQSRDADRRAECLLNDLQLLPIPEELHIDARDFAAAWTRYLEVRDTEAQLIFGNRIKDAFHTDLSEGDPSFRSAYASLRRIKQDLDDQSTKWEEEVRWTGYRAVVELVVLGLAALIALVVAGNSLERRRALESMQVLNEELRRASEAA